MASINKLSIRGVRAFNPEDVEQVRRLVVARSCLVCRVHFDPPLEYIVRYVGFGCGRVGLCLYCLEFALTPVSLLCFWPHYQCVEFYCPITIIVGSNGCGK